MRLDHPGQIYEFGPFRLEASEGLLLKDGEQVPLSPKSFEVLCILVRRSGHLVTKEEILRKVWPDSFIEESNLARNIYLLRKTLGCGTEEQTYIKTVPRKGYRFIADVIVARANDDPVTTEHPAPTLPATEVDPAIATQPVATKPVQTGRRYNVKLLVAALVLLVTASALYFLHARRQNSAPGLPS